MIWLDILSKTLEVIVIYKVWLIALFIAWVIGIAICLNPHYETTGECVPFWEKEERKAEKKRLKAEKKARKEAQRWWTE